MSTRFAPYLHQMAPLRPRSHPLLLGIGIVLVIIGQIIATVAIFGAVDMLSGRAASTTLLGGPLDMVLLLATFIGFIAGVFVAMRAIHRHRMGALLGPGGRFEWGRFVRSAGLLTAVGVVLFAGSWAYQSYVPNAGWGVWAIWLLPLLAVLFLQVFAEELVFRGYLQGKLAARYASPWIWLVFPAVLFGVIHLPTAIPFGATAPLVLAVPTLIGLIAGHITARTGGIAIATGLHFANNLIGLAIVAIPGPLGALALWHHDIDIHDPGSVAPMLVTNIGIILALYGIYLWITRKSQGGLQDIGQVFK